MTTASLCALVGAVALTLRSGRAQAQLPTPGPYTLSALGVHLFYNDTGGFSQNIPEDAALWNTIIGEGWAGKASNATLVRVTVAGAPGSYANRTVQVSVQKGTRTSSGSFQWGRVF